MRRDARRRAMYSNRARTNLLQIENSDVRDARRSRHDSVTRYRLDEQLSSRYCDLVVGAASFGWRLNREPGVNPGLSPSGKRERTSPQALALRLGSGD